MKKYLILQIPLLFVLMIITGCYTIISHPGEEGDFVDRSGRYDNYSEYYGYTHYYYPDYWSHHPRWGHFWATPWWWDYYDYYDAGYYDETGSPRPPQGERAVPSPGRWDDDATVNNPNIIRGEDWGPNVGSGPSPGSTGGTTVKPGSSSGKESDQPKETREKKKEEKSKENKRGGRWRKR